MNKFFTAIAVLALAVSGCGNSQSKKAESQSLAGAGATFPLPFYNLAFKTYQEQGTATITYGGIGSGGGIRSLKDKIIDFGGSDAYLSDKEISEMPAEVIHIPTCIGAVVLAYNVDGVENLKLTGDLISDIYLGKITKWNDAAIAAVNPGVKLPDLVINPVYRSDGSGTTYVFSDYLTKVSPEWAQKVGTGKSLKWEAGIAAKGNPGVAGTIRQTSGSIGYIGSEYAFALQIPVAELQNGAGNFVVPNTETISASASGEMPADTRAMITNAEGANAYPISCFTWVIMYKDQAYNNRTEAQAAETVRLMNWMIDTDAQALTTKVHYSPLPAEVVAKAKVLLEGVTYNGKAIQ
ncbi:MAG: phosphate ABC transporter substrate-binding protein PstS [Marinifilaceae bacterium]